MRILGISGSLRRGSYNTSLLETIKTLLPPGMTLEIVTPIAIPVFNGDDELGPAAVSAPPVSVTNRPIDGAANTTASRMPSSHTSATASAAR